MRACDVVLSSDLRPWCDWILECAEFVDRRRAEDKLRIRTPSSKQTGQCSLSVRVCRRRRAGGLLLTQ